MKIFWPIIYLLLPFLHVAISISIECAYENLIFNENFGKSFFCDAQTDPLIISPDNATIDSVVSTFSVNNHVTGFRAYDKQIHFFPKGLEKIFRNIKILNIAKCGMKEVHQSDLQPFPDLTAIILKSNRISVIEEGLFAHNFDLKFIDFSYNNIYRIHSDVFDDLKELSYLLLDANSCISLDAQDNSTALQRVIQSVKENCLVLNAGTSVINTSDTEELEVTSASLSYLDKKIMIMKNYMDEIWMELTSSIAKRSAEIKELRDSDVESKNKLELLETEIKNMKIEDRNFKTTQWENVNKFTAIEYGLNRLSSTATGKFEHLDMTVKYLQDTCQEKFDAVEEDFTKLKTESSEIIGNLQNLFVGAVKRIESLESALKNSHKNFESLKKELQKIERKLADINGQN